MGTTPRFNSPGQFDHFCKLVLRNEAINYLRELKYRRDNETVFSAMPQAELDNINFVVTPVYKEGGEPMRDILLKLMLAELGPA